MSPPSSTTDTTTDTPEAGTSTSARPGTAGRIDYDKWHKVTNDLVQEVEEEEEKEIESEKKALGLDGKYASSQAEAEERVKAKQVKKAKKALDAYKKREGAIVTTFDGLLGPVPTANDEEKGTANISSNESKDATESVVRITRNDMDAGKRVLTVSNTSGKSLSDVLVLTQDLSLLESVVPTNQNAKQFKDDAENEVQQESEKTRSVFGIIKCFIRNVHNCTILVKCKIITGTIEVSHCSNVVIRMEKESTVATVQADLCQNITIEYRDAPSVKNTSPPGREPNLYWGEDKEDRIFHAGVSNMLVKVIRDGFVETERLCDYEKDGAEEIGNASKEEFQFVTSVLDGTLMTEQVVRAGSTTGRNARVMTQRELDAEKAKREKAASMALSMAEDMIKIKDKDGNEVVKKTETVETVDEEKKKDEEEEIEEVYGSMSKEQIDLIVEECEQNKKRGNEAFSAGEYGQAILLYSLSLDKADELPDKPDYNDDDGNDDSPKKQLFPRDIVLSNRAACFLKLGQHEKAEDDAKRAMKINSENVKAKFRCGLARHAMGNFGDAITVLAQAYKLEPKNKHIKQALQFAEVRMTQELRKRMEG